MIDHVSITVSDLAAASALYEPVLGAIGMEKLVVREGTVGFGKKYPEFWLNERPGAPPTADESGHHVCLRARTPQQVDDFHAAALAAGGKSDGAPGMRPEYHSNYYAAFVRDLDGNRVEVVTFVTE
jgi:catechol 2,3-dioxygenase-like lactoylglutathione lyase family enzyme